MDDWEGENIKMKKIIVHPQYDPNTTAFDFAVVVLESDTNMEVTFPPLNSNETYPDVYTDARVMGWGTTSSGGNQSNVLLEVDYPIISNDDCDGCYGGGQIEPNMMCAYADGGGKDSCQG